MGIGNVWVFIGSFIVAPFIIGYIVRRKRWLKEDVSKPIFTWNIIVFLSLASFVGGWNASIDKTVFLLPLAGFSVHIIGLILGWGAARFMKLANPQKGALILSTGLSNLGTTMGALICYLFLGNQGYSNAIVYGMFWNLHVFLICFPLAKYYAASSGHMVKFSAIDAIKGIFTDIRSLPLYGVIIGLVLKASGIKPLPFLINNIVVIIAASAALSLFAIGLTTYFSKLRQYMKFYFVAGGIKFVILPLITLVIIMLMGLQGVAKKVVFIQSFMPVAVYATMISNLFDLDRDLGNSLFIVTTIVFIIAVLPIIAVLINFV